MKLIKITPIIILLLNFSCTQDQPESAKEKDNHEKVDENEKHDTKNQTEDIVRPESFERGKENPVSDLGVGLIIAPENMTLYNDSLLEDPYLEIDMTKSAEIPEEISPLFFEPELGVMHFVCLKTTRQYLKVLVNFDEYKFFSRDKKYKIKKWGSYLFQSYGVKRKFDDSGAPLNQNHFTKNNHSDAEIIDIPGEKELFCPVKINGEWLKVKYDCNSNSYEGDHQSTPCFNYIDECDSLKQGWIKWKDRNQLLIKIYNNF